MDLDTNLVWEKEGNDIVSDDGSFSIIDNKLFVAIERGDFLIGNGELELLKKLATKYMIMLNKATSMKINGGFLDTVDIVLLPQEDAYRLRDYEKSEWGDKLPFDKLGA